MAKTAKPVRYDELEGKVVAGAGYGCDTMLIAFTDGTVLALSADEGHDGAEINFAQGSDIDLQSHKWASIAHESGIATREEWQEAVAAQESRRIARLESELEELKNKRA